MFCFDFEMRLEIGGLTGIRRWGCEAIIVDCRLKKNGTADFADDGDYCNLIGDCGAVEKATSFHLCSDFVTRPFSQ